MRKTNVIARFFFFPALLACSCHSASSPETSGTISGTVILIDTAGNSLLDNSGVRIWVEGSSQSVETNSEGYFKLQGLPDGIIPLVFSKLGFAELYDRETILHASQIGSFVPLQLFAISKMTPNITIRPFADCYIRYNFRDTQKYSVEAGGIIHYWLYDSMYETRGLAEFSSRILNAPNRSGHYSAAIRMYFSKTDSISSLDPDSFEFASSVLEVNSADGTVTYDLYRDSLEHHGFKTDSKIYCAAFASGENTYYQSYIEPASGKKIYTGFSPLHSEVKSFILP